jgi:hypothetical protein
VTAQSQGTKTTRGAPRPLRIVIGAAALVLAIASPVLAARIVTDPEPDRACPAESGSGVLSWYATTVDTPADSTTWQVSVEFTIEGGTCELSLATYELPGPTFTLPQQLFDSMTGTFGPGTHVLTAALPREGDLPGCFSQYDFVFGPAIEMLTETDKYGDRQVRARIVGSETCEVTVVSTPTPTPEDNIQESTPTPTPEDNIQESTPTPEDGVQEGTGTPAPDVPDTAVSAPATMGPNPMVPIMALLFVLSAGTLATLSWVHGRNR